MSKRKLWKSNLIESYYFLKEQKDMFIDNEHISEINAFKTVQSNLLFQSKLRNFKKIIQDMKKTKIRNN